MENKIVLKGLTLNGFKSFGNKDNRIDFGAVTVLIGANGAGKSNLISFFKMISYMMTNAFEQFVGEQGFASSILHYGPKATPRIHAKLEFENNSFSDAYSFSLSHAAQDSLLFTEEIIHYHDKKNPEGKQITLPIGLKESGLKLKDPKLGAKPIKMIHSILCNCRVYQFHDSSMSAKIRNGSYINLGEFLYSDGGNLAAFLFGLKENPKTNYYYQKVVRRIRQVFPQFEDFILKPSARNESYIMLDWCEKEHPNYQFGPHQLSDGTIRFMALAALLLQPPATLPNVIILDEPELGLHPAAIISLSEMIKTASLHSQVILATQNPALLDEFSPEEVVVIERNPQTKSSECKKFTKEELELWLQNDMMSELWDKNILGGRP